MTKAAPFLLPIAAVTVAMGWLGYTLLARPSSAVVAEGRAAPGARPKLVAHRPPTHRRILHRDEVTAVAPSEKPELAGAGAATSPAAVSVLPSGEPRPHNVVHATPEEMAVHRTLTPLVARHKDASLNFVTCEAAAAPTGEGEPGALTIAPRDPRQPICLARIQVREPEAMREILRDASASYRGHLAIEWREHIDAYTGHWWQADVRTDTDESYPLPNFEHLATAPPVPEQP